MKYLLMCIFIMAIVTYIPRVLPLTLFTKKIKSTYIKSLLNYMPYSVLGAMTFPAIFYCTNNMIFSIIGTGVALTLAYFEKKLITVALLSVLSIYLLNLVIL